MLKQFVNCKPFYNIIISFQQKQTSMSIHLSDNSNQSRMRNILNQTTVAGSSSSQWTSIASLDNISNYSQNASVTYKEMNLLDSSQNYSVCSSDEMEALYMKSNQNKAISKNLIAMDLFETRPNFASNRFMQNMNQHQITHKQYLSKIHLQLKINELVKVLKQKDEYIKELQLKLGMKQMDFKKKEKHVFEQRAFFSQKHRQFKYSNHINKNQLVVIRKDLRIEDLKYINEFNFPNIRLLDMSWDKIDDQGLKALVYNNKALNIPNLAELNLNNNQITNIQCIKHLNLSNLKKLNLSNNKLSLKSAQFLKYRKWENLERVSLSFCKEQNQKCWQILSKDNFQQFPSLKAICIRNSQELSEEIKSKISKMKKWQKLQFC